jgi:hypothetical protein
MPTYKKRNESSIVTSVGKYLQLLENNGKISFWTRMQAGTVQFQRNSKWQSMRMGREGIADILAFTHYNCDTLNGEMSQIFWIECKLYSKQSESQVVFQSIVEKCGHYYWVIHNLDELEAKFKSIGVL